MSPSPAVLSCAVRSIYFCFFVFAGFSRAESPEAGEACPWQPPMEFQCTPAAGSTQSGRLVGRFYPIWLWKVCPSSAHDLYATCLAVHIRVGFLRRFCELTVFDA